MREDIDDRLRASLCSRTAALDQATDDPQPSVRATDDLAALGRGTEPGLGPSEVSVDAESDPGGSPNAVLWSTLAAAAVAVLGVTAWRRRA